MAEETRVPTAEAVPADTGRTSTTAALRYRDFRLFWFGMVISNVGSWMQLYGLGYLVVQLAIRDGVPQLAPFYIGLLGLARAAEPRLRAVRRGGRGSRRPPPPAAHDPVRGDA